LDRARRDQEPNASRWDYVLGYPDHCVAMEVHPAKASEVDAVIRKKQWADALLRNYCALRVASWHWVRPPGSALQFAPQSPQARRLAKSGIAFPTARLPR